MPTELTEILSKGEISFAQFMEMALYHREWGYYSKNSGTKDYYTNVDVHSIFSEILGLYFTQVWENNFKQEPFYIIELGCGNGKLARGILKELSKNSPELYQNLKFIGIERSKTRLEACENLKKEFGEKINFLSEFNFPDNSISGIIYSNEFFDALPIHRIYKKEGQLQEVVLGPSLRENLRPLSSHLQDYFSWLGGEPHEDCFGEAHLASREWIRKMARSMSKGLILTIDYGFKSEELYSEFRVDGTALCLFQNKTNRNFYERIGDQDMTAHINFSVLEKEAASFGFKSHLITQSKFLLENGLEKMIEGAGAPNLDDKEKLKRSLAIRSLIHPEGMGGTFKVLLQSKGIQ